MRLTVFIENILRDITSTEVLEGRQPEVSNHFSDMIRRGGFAVRISCVEQMPVLQEIPYLRSSRPTY